MENVPNIYPYEKLIPWNQFSSSMRLTKKWEKKTARKPGRHFSSLSRLVGDTHLNLVETRSPIRLCVRREKEDILMDIVTLDESEKVGRMFTRLITHDDMDTIVKRVHNQMGLILDYSV